MNLPGRFGDEELMKKFVMATAIAVASLVGALAVWLWERQPWLDPPTVGATAAFAESADCLFRYGNAFAGRDQGVRLDNDKVASCFPRQTAATKKALIACFNTYERNHPNHPGWPEENMRRCTWDGLTEVPAPFSFGKAVAVPAIPRAGRRFVLEVGVTGSDSAADEADTAIKTGTLDVFVLIDGAHGVYTPLSFTEGLHADGKIHVSFTVPKTADGMRLTIKLTIAPDTPTGTKIVHFTVRR
jgi:hypothetical protein